MELFIDAYDWVMVPKVYGMALYADGGLITTKLYVAASSYLRKMSDFPRGTWCDMWNALFWSFLAQHRAVFQRNQRLAILTRRLDTHPEQSSKLSCRGEEISHVNSSVHSRCVAAPNLGRVDGFG
jgi:deoxyribodipyrimidine photolyase-like uncharacterized protein